MTTFIGGISSGAPKTISAGPSLKPISSKLTPAQIAKALGKPIAAPKKAPKITVPKGYTKVTNVYGAPAAPAVKAQPAATPAAQPAGAPAPAAPGAAADQYPLDDTYKSNTDTNLFNVKNKEIGLGQQSAASTQALQAALGNIAFQQPRQQLSLEYAANRRGGLGGTVYDQQASDLDRNIATQKNALTTADQGRQDAITAQIKALDAGIPIYNDQQALASSLRQIALAQKNPATGQDLSVGTTPAATALAAMPPKPANPSSGGHYVNVGGKWQLIHYAGANRWLPGPPPKGKK